VFEDFGPMQYEPMNHVRSWRKQH